MDSGTVANFVDHQLARNLKLELLLLTKPLEVQVLNNQLLHNVYFKTKPLHFTLENHQEETLFLVISSSLEPLVLEIS